MLARFFARRRVRKAHAAHLAAGRAYRDAKARHDTRSMSIASANLRATNKALMAAEVALSKLESFRALPHPQGN